MHVLHVLQGPDRGARHRLPPNEPQLIGRSSEALPITDHTVSRRHAELTPDNGRWYVRDLESANGTFVNGDAVIGRVELKPGDELRVGSTVLRFVTEPDVPESPIKLLEPSELEGNVAGRVGADEPVIQESASEAVRQASEHLRVIYELTAITAATHRRDELMERVLDLVFRELSPDRGFILLQPDGSGRLEPGAVRYRTRPRTRDEGHIPVSRTIVQHVLQKAEGILATNAMTDARFRSGDSVREYGIRMAICVPVRSGRKSLGVLHVDSALGDFVWTEAELRLMNHVGQHLGLALDGAALVEGLMQRERLAAMGETIASLSHSIKNILQGLRGGADAVELALNRGDLAAAREGWPIVGRNLDRILSLTLNMLAWSKQRSVDFEYVQMRPLLQEIAELFSAPCAQRGVRLCVEVEEDMPPVPLDSNALHQALMNLVTNALDAVPERTGQIALRARRHAAAGAAEISVADNGPGVPPEIQHQVFDPFVSTKGQRGTGLGLAVTRKIAEEHGGSVSLRSEPGKGSVFTITLPLDQPEEEKGKTKAPRRGEDLIEWE